MGIGKVKMNTPDRAQNPPANVKNVKRLSYEHATQ
jgi:hypothetical protein